MRHYRKLLIAASLGLVASVAGCGSGGGYDGPRNVHPAPPPPPTDPCVPIHPWDYG
jgi:hypothetical protein